MDVEDERLFLHAFFFKLVQKSGIVVDPSLIPRYTGVFSVSVTYRLGPKHLQLGMHRCLHPSQTHQGTSHSTFSQRSLVLCLSRRRLGIRERSRFQQLTVKESEHTSVCYVKTKAGLNFQNCFYLK